jgi:L-amino acid N-acyltransferase YncA
VEHKDYWQPLTGNVRPRPAYSHTVEATIYLAQDQTGKGFGKALYSELIHSAKAQNFREIMGVIALPNAGSVTLHQSCRFEEAGVLKKAGYKFEKYIDVGIWQLSLYYQKARYLHHSLSYLLLYIFLLNNVSFAPLLIPNSRLLTALRA